jgi:hypothetical protein
VFKVCIKTEENSGEKRRPPTSNIEDRLTDLFNEDGATCNKWWWKDVQICVQKAGFKALSLEVASE